MKKLVAVILTLALALALGPVLGASRRSMYGSHSICRQPTTSASRLSPQNRGLPPANGCFSAS